MPELPEVETHVRDLQPLVGYTVREITTNTPKAFTPTFSRVREKLLNVKIIAIRRRAKHIVFELSNGFALVAHFRMTGHFLIRQLHDPLEKCVRHRFTLTRGRVVVDLRFDDIRKFGTLTLVTSNELPQLFAELGPEPLDRAFTLAAFRGRLEKRRGKLKAILLDQSFVAGIGNIYADEICFTARLHPATPIEKLRDVEIKKLHAAITSELKKGVKNRGTSVGEYVDSRGERGGNQSTLRAYKRHGQPCRICGTMMKKMTITQRTTTYCPKCQPLH